MKMLSLSQLTTLCILGTVRAWISTSSPLTQPRNSLSFVPNVLVDETVAQPNLGHVTTTTLHAGFGSNDKNKKKDIKLKPKQQWDRYMSNLKKMEKFNVAVRVVTVPETDATINEWFEVGNIKSDNNEYTEVAVARQRALIADHARRLFPTKVTIKDKIEWGYRTNSDSNDGAWIAVDKSILDATTNLPDDIDKKIGFEGTPDPATGYYCVYNEGRIVNMVDATADLKLGTSKGKQYRQ